MALKFSKKMMFLFAGLFCHHVIAVFEHLRVDEIPTKYILKRYTKNVVTDPTFNRRDYITTASDGMSIEYRRTLLYNEAMKTVNKGLSSDHMFDRAMSAFKEVNSRLDDDENDMTNHSSCPPDAFEPEQPLEPVDIHDDARSDAYADIQPPPVAKTKGSTTKEKEEAPKQSRPRPEPELDENGKPKGQRLCSNCNKIKGHNARTCRKREMAQRLLEAHTRLYGDPGSKENVKVCIKNLIAKQQVPEAEGEEVLDTDEDEDYEDETEEDEAEEQDDNEDEEEEYEANDTRSQTDNDVEHEKHQPLELATDMSIELINEKMKHMHRICGVCGERENHNARTCPRKKEILEKKLAASQQSGGTDKMMPLGKRICSNCGLIRGHNKRTCMRLQIEEQIRQQAMKELTPPRALTQKAVLKKKNEEVTPLTLQIRRSNRNRG